ncbi:hypothetical protein ITP53_46635 [Nonomuraea sp. K274]|uniref:Uncharacterized protein n=1 Tax=Nonomuraea cypriaca TaxID=1187855 RepID=A0A931ALB1_9ACTN|nr:hypothetical protein [Nonomuraea cypriaca]
MGDLERGGVFAGEGDGLAGAFGQVAQLGLFDGGQFGADVEGDAGGQFGGVEGVQGAADLVGGFFDPDGGLDHVAVGGQVGAGQGRKDAGEGVAFFLPAFAFGVGPVAVGGAGRVGVAAPADLGELGQRLGQVQGIAAGDPGRKIGYVQRGISRPGASGGDEDVAVVIDGVPGQKRSWRMSKNSAGTRSAWSISGRLSTEFKRRA